MIVLWVAGCLLPTGHVDLDAPLLCVSAGPGGVADCESGADVSFEAAARSAAGAMNAVMTVIAYRGDGSVAARWQGPARWLGRIPAAGMMFTGAVNRGRVTWDRASAEDVRVSVVVTRDDGGVPDAVAVGMRGNRTDAASGGGGAGAHAGASDTRHGGDAARAGAYRAGERGHESEGVAGSPRGAGGGQGSAAGDGRGRLARGPRHGGDGSHVTGTRGGSFQGSSTRSSWADESTAALSPRGGRVPGREGAEDGSPAGTGKPDDSGLSIAMPVFGGVISVPPSIAPALDVAAILWEAGIRPADLARKWIRRALRASVRKLRREIAEEAAEHAARALATTENRLARSMDFGRLSAVEQRQILDAMDDAVRREYLARVEDGIAREIAELEQTLARSRARTEPEHYVEGLLRENLEAARRVQDATRQARAELPSAVAQTRTRASSAASPSAPGSTSDAPRALLAPVKVQRHHIFPQKFRKFFEKRGIDIDKFTVEISQGRHLRSVHGRGDAITPGQYNQRWADFIETNPNATANEIYQFGGRLMDEYRLSGLPIVPYR